MLLQKYVNINDEIHFEPFQNEMLMKTLKNGEQYISIIINKSDSKRDVKVITPFELKDPMILFSNGTALMTDNILSIGSEETVVISWSL
jgi:beta-galactosidase